jgi:hypothetical protein
MRCHNHSFFLRKSEPFDGSTFVWRVNFDLLWKGVLEQQSSKKKKRRWKIIAADHCTRYPCATWDDHEETIISEMGLLAVNITRVKMPMDASMNLPKKHSRIATNTNCGPW